MHTAAVTYDQAATQMAGYLATSCFALQHHYTHTTIIIIIITCSSCQEARWDCRQAASKGYPNPTRCWTRKFKQVPINL